MKRAAYSFIQGDKQHSTKTCSVFSYQNYGCERKEIYIYHYNGWVTVVFTKNEKGRLYVLDYYGMAQGIGCCSFDKSP